MSTRKILLPLDGSPLATAAIAAVQRLFDPASTEVILAHVAAIPEGYGPRPAPPSQTATWGENITMLVGNHHGAPPAVYQSQAWASRQAEVLASFDDDRSALRTAGYAVSIEVRFGEPAQELAEMVASLGVDAVVMATHGRSGVSRALLGSVAEQLLRLVEVPVVMQRMPA
jgi:nucleotide-binding universal stress UspA family protein